MGSSGASPAYRLAGGWEVRVSAGKRSGAGEEVSGVFPASRCGSFSSRRAVKPVAGRAPRPPGGAGALRFGWVRCSPGAAGDPRRGDPTAGAARPFSGGRRRRRPPQRWGEAGAVADRCPEPLPPPLRGLSAPHVSVEDN